MNILWSRPPPSRPSQRKILPSFAQLQPPPCKHPLPDCQPDRPLRRMQHFSAGFGPATDTSQNDRRRHASAPAAVTTATTAKDDAPRAMGEPRPRRRAPATAKGSGGRPARYRSRKPRRRRRRLLTAAAVGGEAWSPRFSRGSLAHAPTPTNGGAQVRARSLPVAPASPTPTPTLTEWSGGMRWGGGCIGRGERYASHCGLLCLALVCRRSSR